MPMILLSKGAEILLVQFHEAKGDRVGAQPGRPPAPGAPSRRPRPRAPASISTARCSPCWKETSSARKGRSSSSPRKATTISTSGPGTGWGRASRPTVSPCNRPGPARRAAGRRGLPGLPARRPGAVRRLAGLQRAAAAAHPSSTPRAAPPPRAARGPAAPPPSPSCRRARPVSRRTRGDCAEGGRLARRLVAGQASSLLGDGRFRRIDCPVRVSASRSPRSLGPPGMPPRPRAL